MNIFDYHPTTGAYLGTRPARPDPLAHRQPIYEDRETEDGGVERVQIGETGDAWLIPANATPVAPPSPLAGHVRVWTGATWSLVEDRIGTRYWTPSAGLVTQTALGPLPDGAVVVTGADPDLTFADGVWRETAEADRAARLALSSTRFFLAVQQAVTASGAYNPATDAPIDEWVQARVSASTLPLETKSVAILLLRKAVTFLRADPDAPGLLDAVAQSALGLTSAQVDALFLAATE